MKLSVLFSYISKYFPLVVLIIIPFCALWIRDSFAIFSSSATYRVLIVWLEIMFVASFMACHLRSVPSLQTVLKSRLFLLFLLWQTSAFVSVLVAPFPWPALIRYIEILSHCAFGWCLYRYLLIFKSKRRFVVRGLFVAFIYAVFLIVLLWNVLDKPQNFNWATELPCFDNIRHFGYFIVAIIPLGYLPLLNNNKTKLPPIANLVLSFLILTTAWGVVFWQGGRGCLISAVCGVSLLLLFEKGKWRKFLIFSLVCVICGFLFSKNFQYNAQVSAVSRMNIAKIDNLNSFSSSRLVMYKKGLQQTWEINPWFGVGPDGYRYLRPRPLPVYVQPHGIIPQIIIEWGLLGSTFFLLFIGAFVRKWHQREQNDAIHVLSKASLCALVIHSLVDGVFYHPFSLLTVAYIIPLTANMNSEITEEKLKGKSWSLIFLILFSFVMLLHSYVVYVQKEGQPTDFSTSLIQVFPSYIDTSWWIFKDDSTENRRKYIEIGRKFSSLPGFYDTLEERYLLTD
jgi:hypothetical protein